MSLAIVHMKSRKQIPVIMPWTASEWSEQIDQRWADELPQTILLVDEKGNQIVVPAFEIDFVVIPLEEENSDAPR
jgi:hypothetical protein